MELTIRIRKNRQTIAKSFSLYKMTAKGCCYADIDLKQLNLILADPAKLKQYADLIGRVTAGR